MPLAFATLSAAQWVPYLAVSKIHAEDTMEIKSLKFYLELGKNAVYTLDELESNFYFQEIVAYYQSGIFTRWLRALGEDEKANALEEKIPRDEKDKCLILKTLLEVLELTATPESIKAMERIVIYEQVNNGSPIVGNPKMIEQTVLDSYFERYEEIKEQVRNIDDENPQIEVLAKQFAQEFLTAVTVNYTEILNEFLLDKKKFCKSLFNALKKTKQCKTIIAETIKYAQSSCVKKNTADSTIDRECYLKMLYFFGGQKYTYQCSKKDHLPHLGHLNIQYLKAEDCLSLISKDILLVDYYYCRIEIDECKLGYEIIDPHQKDFRHFYGQVTALTPYSNWPDCEVFYVEL